LSYILLLNVLLLWKILSGLVHKNDHKSEQGFLEGLLLFQFEFQHLLSINMYLGTKTIIDHFKSTPYHKLFPIKTCVDCGDIWVSGLKLIIILPCIGSWNQLLKLDWFQYRDQSSFEMLNIEFQTVVQILNRTINCKNDKFMKKCLSGTFYSRLCTTKSTVFVVHVHTLYIVYFCMLYWCYSVVSSVISRSESLNFKLVTNNKQGTFLHNDAFNRHDQRNTKPTVFACKWLVEDVQHFQCHLKIHLQGVVKSLCS